ncbi:helix-turn-helix domain-containing protein [Actinomycetota bacterium Odt1-20B]
MNGRAYGRGNGRVDGRAVFVADDGGLTVFAEPEPYEVAAHRHPAWKVVLPLGGHVTVNGTAGASGVAGVTRVSGAVGAGAVVPPGYAHTCGSSSGFVAVFLDPWLLRDGGAPQLLEPGRARRLLDALGDLDAPDPAAFRAELGRALAGPPPRAVDPRVPYAVAAAARSGLLGEAAAEVGLSPVRLRALVRTEAGVPLSALRQWRRLAAAVGALLDPVAGGGIAGAATAAGFADQPHLTRTAGRLIGRTPASLHRTAKQSWRHGTTE